MTPSSPNIHTPPYPSSPYKIGRCCVCGKIRIIDRKTRHCMACEAKQVIDKVRRLVDWFRR